MENYIQKALILAIKAHAGQVRKGDNTTPYIVHPLEVALLLSLYTDNAFAVSAAILHDVVEDTDVTVQQIADDVGHAVSVIVDYLTEDKTIADWQQRKDENLQRLRTFEPAYGIRVMDSIANMRDLTALIETEGDSAWNRFNATREQKLGYFHQILKDTTGILPPMMINHYVSTLKKLEVAQQLPSTL